MVERTYRNESKRWPSEGIDFVGRIRTIEKAADTGRYTYWYVSIPKVIVERYGILPDDGLEVFVYRKGLPSYKEANRAGRTIEYTFKEHYHTSLASRTMVIGLNSAYRRCHARDEDPIKKLIGYRNWPDDTIFGIESGDTVGMVGYIPPVAKKLAQNAKRMIIFDHGAWLEGDPDVEPTERQSLLLPECDIVVLTGTTTVNGTIDSLLAMCPKAREIVLVGTSTPMFPEGFRGSGVTRLAGAWWKNEDKEAIFKKVTLAGGIRSLSPHMIMKMALV